MALQTVMGGILLHVTAYLGPDKEVMDEPPCLVVSRLVVMQHKFASPLQPTLSVPPRGNAHECAMVGVADGSSKQVPCLDTSV